MLIELHRGPRTGPVAFHVQAGTISFEPADPVRFVVPIKHPKHGVRPTHPSAKHFDRANTEVPDDRLSRSPEQTVTRDEYDAIANSHRAHEAAVRAYAHDCLESEQTAWDALMEDVIASAKAEHDDLHHGSTFVWQGPRWLQVAEPGDNDLFREAYPVDDHVWRVHETPDEVLDLVKKAGVPCVRRQARI